MATDLPSFEIACRWRPITLVQPGTTIPQAPYAAVELALSPGSPDETGLRSGDTTIRATYDGERVGLVLTHAGRTTEHRSRRHGRARHPDRLALTLTGNAVVAFVREDGDWVARAFVDLIELDAWPSPHDDAWLAGLAATDQRATAGRFGQLGLRDPRLVSYPDGTPYRRDGLAWFTASSAGPTGFRSGHTSVWSLDPLSLEITHRADHFFRRQDRPGVYGDHATHLVRDGGSWLFAPSTWGDFDPALNPRVGVTLGRSDADLLSGVHVLDTAPLALPTADLRSVGTWDAHLVRAGGGWLVAFVNATKFFRFHPAVATGPSLGDLTLQAAATGRTATEGPTLLHTRDGWRLLASDGRDGRRSQRAAYPIFDLDLRRTGTLDATYPSNLPWPTLVRGEPGDPHPWLLIGFDGTRVGGPLLGHGTHGELVIQRARGD